jgi:hypothetical protein
LRVKLFFQANQMGKCSRRFSTLRPLPEFALPAPLHPARTDDAPCSQGKPRRRLPLRSARTPISPTIETEKEIDGRWLAEIKDLPGVLAYGETEEEAMTKAEALALRCT